MDTRFCLHPTILGSNLVPCGNCPVCRMKYRKQMATRIYMEMSIEKPVDNYFITLTYDDEHIPNVAGRQCFNKDHLIRFLDSLRHKLRPRGLSLRYFATCEYGEEGYRPHYHLLLLLYGEGKPFLRSPRSRVFEFNRDYVEPLWPYGFSYDGRVSIRSVMYCTCYALKDDEALERDWSGFEQGKPFRLFSLRPGLGLTSNCVSWWLEYTYNDGDYRYGLRIGKGLKHPISSSIPVAVKRRFKNDNPGFYEDYKSQNQRNREDSLSFLASNVERYGPSKVYGNSYPGDRIGYFSRVPDDEVIAFRKALRELSKRERNPLK